MTDCTERHMAARRQGAEREGQEGMRKISPARVGEHSPDNEIQSRR